MPDTPAAPTTPEVYTDSAGATHSEHDCRWTPSVIYPGFEACLVNPVSHYREDSAHHTEAFGPSPDTAHLAARSTLSETLDVLREALIEEGLLDDEPSDDVYNRQATSRILARLSPHNREADHE